MSKHRKRKRAYYKGPYPSAGLVETEARTSPLVADIASQLDAINPIPDEVKANPICSICGGSLATEGSGWEYGNNAQPINNGRCCDDCDRRVVIPARLNRAREGRDVREVDPDWQTIGETVLEDIRRDAKNNKLEQALRTAGLVKPFAIGVTNQIKDPLGTDLPVAGNHQFPRGGAYQAKYTDGSSVRGEDAELAQKDFEAVREWLRNGGSKLLAPQHPLMHKALAAGRFGVVAEDGEQLGDADTSQMQSILIRHDWAAVLGDAPDTQGDWLTPYPLQCFEFLVEGTLRGKREALPVLAIANATTPVPWALLMLRTFSKCFWMFDRNHIRLEPDGFRIIVRTQPGLEKGICDLAPLHALVYRQIRAACILLEAKVAESKPLRDMGYKRNAPPSNNGMPLPKLGYNIVELADRHRVERLPPGPVGPLTRRRPRLHFRAGHWRHYVSHRTRIPWTLAGNAELGFVEKEYRL